VHAWRVGRYEPRKAAKNNTDTGERAGQLALTSTQRSNPKIVANVLFYMRETPPQPQPVLVTEAWPDGEPKVIVDTNAMQGDTAITDYWPSPDGRQVPPMAIRRTRPLPPTTLEHLLA
jgi:hypothetical protein